MPSSIWPLYLNTLGLFAWKLKRSSNPRAGRKRLWIRYKVDSFIRELQRKSPLGNCECCSILCMLYADRNSCHDVSCQEGLHIRQLHPYSTRNYSQCQSYTSTYTTWKHTKIPNSSKASASRKCGSSRIVRNTISLPPPQSSCLSDMGVMPVLDATS